jgi:protein SCO1/2
MRQRKRMATIGIAIVAVAVLLGGGLAVLLDGSKQEALGGNKLPAGIDRRPAPGFRLADARGGSFGTGELAGKPYAITFLYTHCKDVCPLIGEELHQALEHLGPQAKKTAIVAVSVDPKGDTRSSVRAWLRAHHEPRNFHYLLSTRAELEPVWRGYFVGPQPEKSGESRHSASVWLVDARGRWRAHYSAGAPFAPKDVAHDLRVLIDRG